MDGQKDGGDNNIPYVFSKSVGIINTTKEEIFNTILQDIYIMSSIK